MSVVFMMTQETLDTKKPAVRAPSSFSSTATPLNVEPGFGGTGSSRSGSSSSAEGMTVVGLWQRSSTGVVAAVVSLAFAMELQVELLAVRKAAKSVVVEN